MAQPRTTANGNSAPNDSAQSYFEQQRDILVGEIAQSLESVLQNINKLNRSLEEVISVGNEFSPVEALWSQFENVMAKDPEQTEETRDGAPLDGRGEEHEEEDVTEVGDERK